MPAAALAVFLAACAATAPATAPGVRAELAPTGTLRVAVFTGNPVLGTRDKASGEVTGTTVTMGRALAARADVPLRIIEYTAIAKLVEDAKTGEWDIAVVAFDPAAAQRRGLRAGAHRRRSHFPGCAGLDDRERGRGRTAPA